MAALSLLQQFGLLRAAPGSGGGDERWGHELRYDARISVVPVDMALAAMADAEEARAWPTGVQGAVSTRNSAVLGGAGQCGAGDVDISSDDGNAFRF